MSDNSAEFWAAIWGAIVGVVGGGLISLGLQLHSLKEARADRASDRKDVMKALASSLLFKIVQIHTNLHTLSKHFEESYASAPKAEPWQFLFPLANPPGHIDFSPDEMGMLLQVASNDLFNRVMNLDRVHNSNLEAIRTLDRLRTAIHEALPIDQMVGNRSSSNLSAEEMLRIRPAMVQFNSLSDQLRSDLSSEQKVVLRALDDCATVFREKFQIPMRFEISRQPNVAAGG